MSGNKFLYLLSFVCLISRVSAQETIIGLQRNSQIALLYQKSEPSKGISADDTLTLPFVDDFSTGYGYPDIRKWSDRYAYINDTYSSHQITTGVATLDAFSEKGELYETASPQTFEADHLTSKPIDLNYPASANVWLSFFYQAGGNGDMPEPRDSLALHFYSPTDRTWHSVWRTEGPDTLTGFKLVMIKIDQQRFLKKGFRLRFVNYASLPRDNDNLKISMYSNCDHWNIDYVRLDRNRNETDTVMRDVALRLPLRSLLKTHESMPWNQFREIYLQEMGSSIPITYRNNDNIVRNVTRFFEIKDLYKNTMSYAFSGGAVNTEPFTDVNYNANLIYTYNTDNADSALFLVKCFLKTDVFDRKENDTLTYLQRFSNYFAFDDGTAEGGYGINGEGSRNAMVAFRFKSFIRDTIRAIDICFNDSYLNSNRRSFDLMIWKDNEGLPGEVIYTLENQLAEPSGKINGFRRYLLPDGVPVEGEFYAGWKQRSETFLNVGIDLNTPHKGRHLFWLKGSWQQSEKNGTLMIHPVVGKPVRPTSVEDPINPSMKAFRLWPNPASEYINIETDENITAGRAGSIIRFIDLQGR
ncbi:MAG: hypothetical protein HPY62_08270 [Bacteroidales bacterium]|nr:hypothetical protein [Bacteroidales bacterium]